MPHGDHFYDWPRSTRDGVRLDCRDCKASVPVKPPSDSNGTASDWEAAFDAAVARLNELPCPRSRFTTEETYDSEGG
jgi:hypothetical protein